MSEHPNDDTREPLVPQDVRDALDGLRVPPARAELRDALRDRFLEAGASLNAELTDLESELAARELPGASPEFRADLRERFLAAGADRAAEAPVASAATSTEGRPAVTRAPRRRRTASRAEAPRGRLLTFPRALGALAAAAALVIAVLVLDPGGSSVPVEPTPSTRWQPVEVAAESGYVVDGVRFAASDAAPLDEALTLGDCRLATEDDDLSVLWLEEGVMLEFARSSEVRVLPAPAGEHGLIEIEVLSGGVRVATRESFLGRILVHTPDITVALAGHSLGVDVFSSGTCLCVLEGTARLTLKAEGGEETREVLSNRTTFVQRGEVLKSAEGVHHADEMKTFLQLGERHLF